MKENLHNRIGTRVKQDEYIITDQAVDKSKIKRGNLVAYLDPIDSEYYWALFLGRNSDEGENKINLLYCKNKNNTKIWVDKLEATYDQITILKDSTQEVEQDIKDGFTFNKENLIEVYNINNQ